MSIDDGGSYDSDCGCSGDSDRFSVGYSYGGPSDYSSSDFCNDSEQKLINKKKSLKKEMLFSGLSSLISGAGAYFLGSHFYPEAFASYEKHLQDTYSLEGILDTVKIILPFGAGVISFASFAYFYQSLKEYKPFKKIKG